MAEPLAAWRRRHAGVTLPLVCRFQVPITPLRRLVGHRIAAMRCYGRGGGSASRLEAIPLINK